MPMNWLKAKSLIGGKVCLVGWKRPSLLFTEEQNQPAPRIGLSELSPRLMLRTCLPISPGFPSLKRPFWKSKKPPSISSRHKSVQKLRGQVKILVASLELNSLLSF